MEQDKLKVAVLGVKDDKGNLLETAAESDYFELAAVADKETESAQNAGKQYGCQWFDDYRQMVMGCRVDCLLVAAGLYSCSQHIRLAMEKGIHIFKLSPPGRNFAQVSELIQFAHNKNIRFAVSAPARYCESFNALKDSIERQQSQLFTLVTVNCSYSHAHRPMWHNDPQLGGGGVLLRDGYEIIDFIVSTFGVPEQVYALMTNNAEDKQQRHALTEDTATVTMKFTGGIFANLILRRMAGAEKVSQTINCYGRDKQLSATADWLEVKEPTGRVIKKKKYVNDASDRIAKTLENFALSILEPQDNKLICQPQEHLKNMSVIDSAYLSWRTAMPEEPAKILSME